jgi:hypothetical protein
VSDTDKVEPRLNILASVVAYALRATRPQFHTAVYVLYWTIMSVPIAWATVAVRRLFGEHGVVDYTLLAFFAGPLGLGAIASACYEFLFPERNNPWVRCAVFGGVTGLVFSLLVDLKNRDTTNFVTGTLVGVGMALIFILLRWLMLREAESGVA